MRRLSLVLAVLLTTGCYHATIDTGIAPSAQVIDQQWAHSFVYGLVPPATVNTTSQCQRGVAKVETRHSFLNGLVAGLTWGLYTPITIRVTCAQ